MNNITQTHRPTIKRWLTAAMACSLLISTSLSAGTLQKGSDFNQLAQTMRDQGKPLVLAFDAEHCHYCARLEADHLDPMAGSEDYQHVLIRSLEFDGAHEITDFDGQRITANAFSERYNVRITPTLLFLNAKGEEIAERMLGFNTPELYGAYLDRAIGKAVKKIATDLAKTESAESTME